MAAAIPPRPRRGRILDSVAGRTALVVLVGYGFGFGSAHLPASPSGTQMWAANLSAPYLLLPFLAGALLHRSPARAALAGAAACASAIAGFYDFLGVGDVTAAQVDAPPTTTARALVVGAYLRWFSTFLLGVPGGTPWLSIALVTGAVLGLVGFEWRASRRWWLAASVGAAFLLEPFASVLLLPLVNRIRFGLPSAGYALSAENLALWSAEGVVGLAGIALAFLLRPPPARREEPVGDEAPQA